MARKSDRDVLVVATDEDFWRLHTDCAVACQDNNTTAGARYIAFYRISPISAVTHYASVKAEIPDVDPRQTLRNSPLLMAKAAERGWLCRLHKHYKIGDLVELRPCVKKAHNEVAVRKKEWTTLAKLRNAKTLRDLREA